MKTHKSRKLCLLKHTLRARSSPAWRSHRVHKALWAPQTTAALTHPYGLLLCIASAMTTTTISAPTPKNIGRINPMSLISDSTLTHLPAARLLITHQLTLAILSHILSRHPNYPRTPPYLYHSHVHTQLGRFIHPIHSTKTRTETGFKLILPSYAYTHIYRNRNSTIRLECVCARVWRA